MPQVNPVALSYACAKRDVLLDSAFTRKVDNMRWAHNRFDGQALGGGADSYMAGANVINLAGVGKKRAAALDRLGITTIAQFASFTGPFVSVMSNGDAGVMASLQGALKVCGTDPAWPFVDGEEHWQFMERVESWPTQQVRSGDGLSDTLKAQIIAATHESSYTDTRTIEDALAAVDENMVNVTVVREQRTNMRLLVVEYGAGDNSYGAIFELDSTRPLAGIHDGSIDTPAQG